MHGIISVARLPPDWSVMTYSKTITTARLILRKPQPSDEAALFAMHSDPEVMRYFSEPPWTDASRATRQNHWPLSGSCRVMSPSCSAAIGPLSAASGPA